MLSTVQEFIPIILKTILIAVLIKVLNSFYRKKPKNISGQLALVTGSAQGLGRALANSLAHEGCDLALVDINDEKNKEAAREIQEKFPNIKVKSFKTDVSKNTEIEKLKADIKDSLGSVDILVNNAALLEFNVSILEGRAEDYERVVNVNLMSHFWTIRTFLPDMIKNRKGHIVAVGSSCANCLKVPFVGAYSASKVGISALMNSFDVELEYSNVNDFIKTTTALPLFVNSESVINYQVINIIGDKSHPPSLKPSSFEPQVIADKIVKDGILLEQKELYVPWFETHASKVMKLIPIRFQKYLWLAISKYYYEYLERRCDIYRDMIGAK